MKLNLKIKNKRPFFAEIPYYLWGEVNYDSDGDCEKPTDQNWNQFYLRNRENSEEVIINGENSEFLIESDNEKLVNKNSSFS